MNFLNSIQNALAKTAPIDTFIPVFSISNLLSTSLTATVSNCFSKYTLYTLYSGDTAYGSSATGVISATGLTAYTAYDFYVVASNSTATTRTSAVVSSTTDDSFVPEFSAGADGSITSSGFNISITAEIAKYTTYSLYINDALYSTASYPDTTIAVSGLDANTSYSCYIIASNSTTATTRQSATQTVVTDVNFVPALTISDITTDGFTVTSTTKSKYTSYQLYVNGSYTSSSTTGVITVTGLTDSTTYSYYVIASNSTTETRQSLTYSATTTSYVPALSISDITTVGFIVTSTTLSAYTNYKLYINGVLNSSSTTGVITASGLTASTTYSYYVIASNSTTETRQSATYYETTPAYIAYFAYTGADQIFTLPVGAVSAVVECWGAGGATTTSGRMINTGYGGGGGYTKGTFSVSSYTTMNIVVGRGGQSSLNAITVGYGGGGANIGNDTVWGHSSGGGRSAVKLLVSGSYTEIITAGAGGAGGGVFNSYSSSCNGYASGGAGGGLIGGNAYSVSNEGGKGGTQTAGGSAGADSGFGINNAGTQYTGGSVTGYGESGGGGYYGGGAGNIYNGVSGVANMMSGGGGGSSYVNANYGTQNAMEQASGYTVANNAGLPSSKQNTIGNGAAASYTKTGSAGQNGYVKITISF